MQNLRSPDSTPAAPMQRTRTGSVRRRTSIIVGAAAVAAFAIPLIAGRGHATSAPIQAAPAQPVEQPQSFGATAIGDPKVPSANTVFAAPEAAAPTAEAPTF